MARYPAEATVTIADEFQGLGLGTLLLERLGQPDPRHDI
jgi:hypothetical protein